MSEINRVQIREKLHSFTQYENLPPGTTIGTRPTDRTPFVKRANGLWEAVNNPYGEFQAENNFSLGTMMVLTYPDGYTPQPAVPMTLHQWKWQFRDFMFAAQEMHGVSHDAVRRAMDELGVAAEEFPLGPTVTVESSNELDRLPEGTIIFSGSPANHARCNLFVKRNGLWHGQGFGALRAPRRGQPSYIEGVPGVPVPPEWWTREGDGSDAEDLLLFKQRAWQVALKVKSNQQWCSTLEACVARVGLDPSVMQRRVMSGITVGQNVNQLEAVQLPVGTILRWRHLDYPTERVIYFVRDNATSNVSRTRRLFGYRSDDRPLVHTARAMEVVAFPPNGDGWFSVEVDLPRALPLLDPGTLLAYRQADPQYVVAEDHRIASMSDMLGYTGTPPANGRWGHEAFDDPQYMRVARFGRTMVPATPITASDPF